MRSGSEEKWPWDLAVRIWQFNFTLSLSLPLSLSPLPCFVRVRLSQKCGHVWVVRLSQTWRQAWLRLGQMRTGLAKEGQGTTLRRTKYHKTKFSTILSTLFQTKRSSVKVSFNSCITEKIKSNPPLQPWSPTTTIAHVFFRYKEANLIINSREKN